MPGSPKSHWPPGGVQTGAVGSGAAVLVLNDVEVVLKLLDVISEEVDDVLDDEEMSPLVVVSLGMVELIVVVGAPAVVEPTTMEELEDDRVEEVDDLVEDDDKALQFPDPAWHPVPQ